MITLYNISIVEVIDSKHIKTRREDRINIWPHQNADNKQLR